MLLAKLALCATMVLVRFFTMSNAMAGSGNPQNSSPSPGSTIYGSEEPDKIYDYLKYHLLIAGYELRVRGALADKLSAEDQQVLRGMALRDPIEQQRITEEYKQARLHLCANRGSMTPVAIAQAWSEIALEWRLKNEARLRKGLDELSETGRRIVEQFVATEIVPGIAQTSPSGGVDDVKRDPDGFMEAVELECYVAENGAYPPGVQEQRDELFRKLEEEERLNETE